MGIHRSSNTYRSKLHMALLFILIRETDNVSFRYQSDKESGRTPLELPALL
jgi:hypothetical protein